MSASFGDDLQALCAALVTEVKNVPEYKDGGYMSWGLLLAQAKKFAEAHGRQALVDELIRWSESDEVLAAEWIERGPFPWVSMEIAHAMALHEFLPQLEKLRRKLELDCAGLPEYQRKFREEELAQALRELRDVNG